MKSAYIVTDNQETSQLLHQILPQNLLVEIQIIASSTRSGALSLASSIMLEKRRPVALVLDAETTEPKQIQEKYSFISSLLLPASAEVSYKILLPSPSAQTLTDPNHPMLKELINFISANFSRVA